MVCTKEGKYTCAKSAFVDPGVHVCALVFELLDIEVLVLDLGLETIDLLEIGFDSFIESSRQRVWRLGQRRCIAGGGIAGALLRSLDGQCIVLLRVLRGSGGGTIRLETVLRIVCTGVLGVFVRRTLVISERTGPIRHWCFFLVRSRSIARQTAEPRHGAKEWNGGLKECVHGKYMCD